jgi:hypothetical protein
MAEIRRRHEQARDPRDVAGRREAEPTRTADSKDQQSPRKPIDSKGVDRSATSSPKAYGGPQPEPREAPGPQYGQPLRDPPVSNIGLTEIGKARQPSDIVKFSDEDIRRGYRTCGKLDGGSDPLRPL